MYNRMMRRQPGKSRSGVLSLAAIAVTLLAWSLIDFGGRNRDDTKLHVVTNTPIPIPKVQTKKITKSPIRSTQEPAEVNDVEIMEIPPLDYTTLTGDFGEEGHAATLIAMPPGTLEKPLTVATMDSSRDPERQSFKILKNVLSRWGERTNTKLPTTTSLSADTIPPTVAIVGGCDSNSDSTKKFVNCVGCDEKSLKQRLEYIKEASTTGNLLLIPHNKITEGLLMMTYMFGFQLGDILHLLPTDNSPDSCPFISSLYMIADETLAKRMEEAVEFSLQLQGYSFALKGLPNYCQGMYSFSQCQLMNNKGWDRNMPSSTGKKYRCPETTFVSNDETVPDTGDAESNQIGRQLLETAWPRCVSKPGGCSPKYGIAFVKTHKTASSTLEGLLHRICVTRRQKCFTHSGKFFNFAYKEQAAYASKPHRTAPALSLPYDSLVAHTMNSPELTSELVPSSEGHVLTIVRESASRYKSHWNFWLQQHQLVAEGWPWKAGELNKMCEAATQVGGKELITKMNREPLNIRLSLNNMARQLMGCTYCGTDTEIEDRFQKLLSAIREPNSKYHILISEKLHESLVLFKRDYGLELVDLVYASRNMGSYKKEMPTDQATCLKKINDLDTRLFEAALEVHQQRVSSLGQEFLDEVKQLDVMVEKLVKNAVCTPKGPWKCEKGSQSALCTQCLDILGQGGDPTGTLIQHFSKCRPL